ncbi:MAG: Gfo/Idh/MocA family oxidoreductase [Planctomycetaceae bacterium]|nr:Gfo/Idh/MocA family oxidoreductase [Planctomycetaceae bacterium]
MNRRSVLKQAITGAIAATAWSPLTAQTRRAANDRLTVALIGCGSRGFNLLNDFLAEPDAQIVAVCDVHDLHYRDRDWGKGPQCGRIPAQRAVEQKYGQARKSGNFSGVDALVDFREVCGRDDIDVIVVATPDHWHARCTMEALQGGKDVYCEKPVTHLFGEGQAIVREVEKHKAIFQTGSQQRSEDVFRRAVEIIRNGVLGKIERIEVGLPPGYDGPQGETTVLQPPKGLDYDLWCGPSEVLPYMRARHHRWWRGHRMYGGGVLMDWIGHHNDIAHWSMDMDNSGPTRVTAQGWTFPETDVYDSPFHYTIECEYANGITSTISDSNLLGTKWIGENGWLHATRGKLTASEEAWTKPNFQSGSFEARKSPGHIRDFLDGVRNRVECIAPAETAHRSITPGHLGYVSHALGRPLKWNPEREQVENDPEADQLLKTVSYREPWTLAEKS